MRDPEKPQQIIEAALRVFARKGYFNARVSDVAREAGIAAGTIYLYFDTKEEILVTLFREKMAGVRGDGAARRSPRSRDAVAKLRRLVRLHSGPEDNPEFAEVVQVELRQGQKLFRGPANQEIAAYFALIGSVFEEGAAAGRFRRPARQGRHEDALRRHGSDGDLVGARQARLPPRWHGGHRGGHLPARRCCRRRVARASSREVRTPQKETRSHAVRDHRPRARGDVRGGSRSTVRPPMRSARR